MVTNHHHQFIFRNIRREWRQVGWAELRGYEADISVCLSLSFSGACHEDVAASTSRRHAGLSIVRRLAVARQKLSGRRSSSTVLSQVCLGLPVLRRQSLAGPRMQAWRAQEWSWPMSARHRWPKKDKCHMWQEQLSSMWPNHIIGDKIRPMDMEDAPETSIIQCIYLLLYGRGQTPYLVNNKTWGEDNVLCYWPHCYCGVVKAGNVSTSRLWQFIHTVQMYQRKQITPVETMPNEHRQRAVETDNTEESSAVLSSSLQHPLSYQP